MSTDPDEYIGTVIEKTAAEVVDDQGVVLAFFRFNRNGSISLNWAAQFFNGDLPPFPDALRKEMVRVLRQHADGLESGDLQKRLTALIPPQGGQA